MEEAPKDPYTQEQMLEALRYVRSYVEFNGGDPFAIDFRRKPKNLPEDVSKAWDTYQGYWDMIKQQGIIV